MFLQNTATEVLSRSFWTVFLAQVGEMCYGVGLEEMGHF